MSIPILHWCLERGGRHVECDIDVNGAGGFALALIPQEPEIPAAIEQFDHLTRALQRHAELVDYLRENGWQVADYSV